MWPSSPESQERGEQPVGVHREDVLEVGARGAGERAVEQCDAVEREGFHRGPKVWSC
jgi:hypothetical protein